MPGGKISFYNDRFIGYSLKTTGWALFDKEEAIESIDGSINGPILTIPVGRNKLAVNLMIGRVDSHNQQSKPFLNLESKVEAIQRALRANLNKYALTDSTRSSTDDREIYEQAIQFARQYERILQIQMKGVHLFHFCGHAHFALTYFRDNLWTRRYAIVLIDPDTQQSFEFCFVFQFDGDFKQFCNCTYLFEPLINSMTWIEPVTSKNKNPNIQQPPIKIQNIVPKNNSKRYPGDPIIQLFKLAKLQIKESEQIKLSLHDERRKSYHLNRMNDRMNDIAHYLRRLWANYLASEDNYPEPFAADELKKAITHRAVELSIHQSYLDYLTGFIDLQVQGRVPFVEI